MVEELTDEKLINCKIIFDLFDKDKDGIISTSELEETLRAVGQNPIQRELSPIINDIMKNYDNKINFAKFLEIYLQVKQTAFTEETLINAFKIFDKEGKGYLKVEEFKIAMTTLGDKMDENAFDQLINQFGNPQNGMIEYRQFVKRLMIK
ncbi:MAG: EF-hand domain-containing protein [archaeon]|nr:EF-hand domain-containing protein [archaeon]